MKGLFLVCAAACLIAASAGAVTMADLEALAGKGAWTELAGRLTDLPPASRDAKWEKLVEKAMDGYLGTETIERSTRAEAALTLLDKYPFLKGSTAVMKRRGELGITGLTACAERAPKNPRSGDTTCLDRYLAFVRQSPDDTKLALEAGRAVFRGDPGEHAGARSVPFFHEGFKHGAKDAVCSDSSAQEAVVQAMMIEQGPPLAPARELAKECWPKLKDRIETLFDKGMGKGFLASACPLLRDAGMLRGLRESRCKKY